MEQVNIDIDLPAAPTDEAAQDEADSDGTRPSPPKTRPTDEPGDLGSRRSSTESRSRRSTLDHDAELVANL